MRTKAADAETVFTMLDYWIDNRPDAAAEHVLALNLDYTEMGGLLGAAVGLIDLILKELHVDDRHGFVADLATKFHTHLDIVNAGLPAPRHCPTCNADLTAPRSCRSVVDGPTDAIWEYECRACGTRWPRDGSRWIDHYCPLDGKVVDPNGEHDGRCD